MNICGLEKSFDLAHGHGKPFLFLAVAGSHMFGFNSPDSDWDLRGAHIARTEDILKIGGNDLAEETIERDQFEGKRAVDAGPNPEEIVTQEVQKFFRLMLKNGGNCLEQVLSPHVVYTTPEIHEQLREIAPRCITQRHLKHYAGFAQNQMALMRRRPDKEVKIFLYIYRTLLSGILMAKGGGVQPHLPTLLDAGLMNVEAANFIRYLIQTKVEGKEEAPLIDSSTRQNAWALVDLLDTLLKAQIAATHVRFETDPKVVEDLNSILLHIRKDLGR